jgi:hypothetical protein
MKSLLWLANATHLSHWHHGQTILSGDRTFHQAIDQVIAVIIIG